MYVGHFEESCPRSGDVPDRLLLIALLYQQKLLDLADPYKAGAAGLGDVRTALRLSGLFLEDLQRDYPELMLGWAPRLRAKNAVQEAANFAREAIDELSETVASVERQHPELRAAFRSERSEYYEQGKDGRS
jgi:hypothetical protein